MRKGVLFTGLAMAAAACGAGEAADQSATGRARLSIENTAPLQVAGRGFKPRERIKLLIGEPKPAARKVTASAAGRFRVRLGVTVPQCQAVVVQAIGARGSRAMADLTTPECAPAPSG